MDSADAFAALYRDAVLDHGRAPRAVGTLPARTHGSTMHNALCGDYVELDLQLDADGRIVALAHRTRGCLLCTASASLMAQAVQGLDGPAAAARGDALHAGIRRGDGDELGPLAALTGVSSTPSRHRCVMLPWEALGAALATGAPA